MPMAYSTREMQHTDSRSDEYPCLNLMMTNSLYGIDSRIARYQSYPGGKPAGVRRL